jgi:hypothetical protein
MFLHMFVSFALILSLSGCERNYDNDEQRAKKLGKPSKSDCNPYAVGLIGCLNDRFPAGTEENDVQSYLKSLNFQEIPTTGPKCKTFAFHPKSIAPLRVYVDILIEDGRVAKFRVVDGGGEYGQNIC